MNQAKIKRHLDKLALQDEDLNRGLELVRYPKPRIREQGFETFLSTIVSQQISTEAAAAIMGRVRALLPRMQAEDVLQLPTGALRDAGLSLRKVEYVEGLAQSMMDKSFDPAHLVDMDRLVSDTNVEETELPDGLSAMATGDSDTIATLRRMVPAHAVQLAQDDRWTVEAIDVEDDWIARLTFNADLWFCAR